GRVASAQEPPAVPSDPTLTAPAGSPPSSDVPPAPPPGAPPPAPMSAPPPAPIAAPQPAPARPADEPIAGVGNGTMFLRSPANMFRFFPNGRRRRTGLFFHSNAPSSLFPHNSFCVSPARLELAGWIDNMVYFQIGGEFASPPAPANSNYVATDDFVA